MRWEMGLRWDVGSRCRLEVGVSKWHMRGGRWETNGKWEVGVQRLEMGELRGEVISRS